MDMARVWPLVCQFGVGSILIGIGVWSGVASGYLDLKNAEDKRLALVIAGGFLAMLLLSAAFTFWLPNVGAEPGP